MLPTCRSEIGQVSSIGCYYFLHGDLGEVYMTLPSGYQRCRGSLYGWKQASQNWFSKFSNVIQVACYHQSKADYSLFIRAIGTSFTAALVCIDDIIYQWKWWGTNYFSKKFHASAISSQTSGSTWIFFGNWGRSFQ